MQTQRNAHPRLSIARRLNSFKRLSTIALMFGTLIVAGLVSAAEPVSKSKGRGVAIGGKDTVAYHSLETGKSQEKAVSGKKSFVVEHKGAKWQFASQASADKFAAEPDKYSPAYNGHCANALSLKKGLLKTNGKHWEIHGDKLYLFYAKKGRTRWNDGNWESYKVVADAEWEKIANR